MTCVACKLLGKMTDLEVGGVGLAIPICSARQNGLVVGDCLLGSVLSHHLTLAMPDSPQSLPLFRRQTLLAHFHCQTLQAAWPGLTHVQALSRCWACMTEAAKTSARLGQTLSVPVTFSYHIKSRDMRT